jgi:hypothetical protein
MGTGDHRAQIAALIDIRSKLKNVRNKTETASENLALVD